MSVDAFIVLACAKLTAGCSGESDDGEELGEGHCDWRRTGRGKEPRRPGSFVLFIQSLYTLGQTSVSSLVLCCEELPTEYAARVDELRSASTNRWANEQMCIHISVDGIVPSGASMRRTCRPSCSKLTFIPVSYKVVALGADTVNAHSCIHHWLQTIEIHTEEVHTTSKPLSHGRSAQNILTVYSYPGVVH